MNLPPVPGLIFQKTKELRLFTGPMSVLMGASDKEIMIWAKEKGYVVFTHDLDFGALLAVSKDAGVSSG